MCIHECSEEHSLHLLYSCLCIVLKKVRLQVITDTPFFVRYAGASKGHNCVARCFLQEDTTCLVTRSALRDCLYSREWC